MNSDPIAATLQSYLPTIFPQRNPARSQPPLLLGVDHITDGWECEVYGFRVQFGAEEQDFILRMYPGDHETAARKAAGEYRALSMLGQAGYPVPRGEHLQTGPGNPFGKPLVVMEFIHGRSLWPLMFSDPDPAVRARSLQTFCGLFAALHRLAWQAVVPAELQVQPASPTELIDRQLAQSERMLKSLPVDGFLPVLAWLHAHKAQAGSTRVSVIHLDFHPNNILLRDDGKAFVIDWTNAALSDYRFDLAWTLLLAFGYAGREAREAVLREYERQAGAVEQLAFFDVFASARRLYSIAVSVKYGAEKLGMRPGAEETMRREKEPVRRVYGLLQEHTGIAVPEVEEILRE